VPKSKPRTKSCTETFWKGAIDIEGWHDPIYRGALEMTAQVHARNYLKCSRGGDFVPNPVVEEE